MFPVLASRQGFVYLVTCPHRVYSKVGRWSNSLRSLEARYATYYGCPRVHAVWVEDAYDVERRLKTRINEENLQMFHGRRLELVKSTRKLTRIFNEVVGGGTE